MRYEFPHNAIAPVDIPASHPVEVYTVRAVDGVHEEPEAVVEAGRLDKVTAHNIVQGGKLVERTQAFMVSPGIAAEEIRRLGFTPFASAQDAVNEAARRKGRSARVIILGMGGEICPVAA